MGQSQRDSVTTAHPSADSLLGDEEEDEAESPVDGCRSLSCLTDSTDHSAPVNFDMSNRVRVIHICRIYNFVSTQFKFPGRLLRVEINSLTR